MRREPRFDATLDTEALLGETVTVYDESEGWAWVQLARDGYVGYMPSEGLSPQHRRADASHRGARARYVYPEPDGKTPPLDLLSLNALCHRCRAERQVPRSRRRRLCLRRPCRSGRREAEPDFVAVAESVPRHALSLGRAHQHRARLLRPGAARARGRGTTPRRAMPTCRRPSLASAIDWRQGTELRRGDLVFWEGHVGIMTSATDFLHANAFHMAVEAEPFAAHASASRRRGMR